MTTRLEKGTKCQKLMTERVSRESQQVMKNLFEGQTGKVTLEDCKKMIYALRDIVGEYLANCPVKNKAVWETKSESMITKLTNNS
jgi:type VI protein secretion system component VasF